MRKGLIHLNKQPVVWAFLSVLMIKAAFKLFDACKKWLADRGMSAMDGLLILGKRSLLGLISQWI